MNIDVLSDFENVQNSVIKYKESVMIESANHFDLYNNFIRLLLFNFGIF